MKTDLFTAASLTLALGIVSHIASAAAAPVPPTGWAQLPRLQLEGQFAGPLQDTVVQKWRDNNNNASCYIYLPISVAHSAPTRSGYVDYGANTIGGISCVAAPTTGAFRQPLRQPSPPR